MKSVYKEAAHLARESQDFVLATVVNTKGSTPQKPGASLLVRGDGSTVGTLGGGCVEGDIWFAAREALREHTGPLFKDYYLNEDIAARDGLVCGGSMFFYIEPFDTPGAFTNAADEIEAAYEGGNSRVFRLIEYVKDFNKGQGLGFVIFGQTVNQRVLLGFFGAFIAIASLFAKMITVLGAGSTEERLEEIEALLAQEMALLAGNASAAAGSAAGG